jgi:hypothetical protein
MTLNKKAICIFPDSQKINQQINMLEQSGHEGFKILQVKFAEESRCPHHLFFKPHSVKAAEPSKPPERTLFCANVPPWITADSLRRIFQNNGPIGTVVRGN